MNYYRVYVEEVYAIDGETHCGQQTFYIGSTTEIDFAYIKRFVNNKLEGRHPDQIDIFVEKMHDNEKF